MPLTELALKWARSRRACTSVLLGSSSLPQLEEALRVYADEPCTEWNNGQLEYLPEEVLWAIDRVHMRNRLPIFSSDRVGDDWFGQGEIGERIP